MSDNINPAISALLSDVDIEREAQIFLDSLRSDIRLTASLPVDGRVSRPRKPRVGNSIIPTPSRPPVLARNRVLLWTTPHGNRFMEELQVELPHSAVLKLFQVMIRSLDESTRSNYGAGLLCFTQFCDHHSIPEEARMPASANLINSFAASAAGHLSPQALSNWIAGLHFWHVVNNARWNGDDMLRHVRRGVAKLCPPELKRAKRPPVTIEAMVALGEGLDLSLSFDAAVWAVACVAFWSCCRLGELVIPSPGAFSPDKHVSRASAPSSFISPALGATSTVFHIPWTKTTLQDGADISVTSRPHISCPIWALRHHLAANSAVPDSAPLFSYETADGSYAPMAKSWFMKRCSEVWASAGFPLMAGHAFRIGGATELLLEGVSPDIVQVQGRWKSQAFLEYWRRIESILPLFISNATNVARLASLDSVMESYQRRHKLLLPGSSI